MQVAAAFVAGLAGMLRAQEVAAHFVELIVGRLQEAYDARAGVPLHNLAMLLAYCYSCGMLAADCMYRWG